MAKKIKAIKCPQCGSTRQEKIDDEHFKCKSCHAEYILDSDDININHHYNYNPAIPQTPISAKKLAGIVGFVLLSMAILMGLGICNSGSETRNSNPLQVNRYFFHNQTNAFLFDDQGTPKLLNFGLINGGGLDRDNPLLKQIHMGVYDLKSKQYEQVLAIQDLMHDNSRENVAVNFQQFDDGLIYILYRNSKVFTYNIQTKKLTDITADIQSKVPAMNTGIGQVKFNFKYYALDLNSNTGKKATYFPSTQLILGESYDPSYLSTIRSNDSIKVGYTTTDTRPGFLVQYEQYKKTGYPVYKIQEFKVQLNDKDQAVKVLTDTYEDRVALIRNTKIMNPTAAQFNLRFIGNNEKYIAYLYKLSVNEGEKFQVQMMDDAGKALWTYNSGLENIALHGTLLTKDGTIVLYVGVQYYIIRDGKLQYTIKHEDMNFKL